MSGNTMMSFNQFVNFFTFLDGPTHLYIQDNRIDHGSNSGSSIILTYRTDYTKLGEIRIENNDFANDDPKRLAVYYAGEGKTVPFSIPHTGQIKVYNNTFHFPNGFGERDGDVALDDVPAAYNANAAIDGVTRDIFDVKGNTAK